MDTQMKDTITMMVYGVMYSQAIRGGTCVNCKGKATWTTDVGEAEYKISGICEPCFKKSFHKGETFQPGEKE